jgi:hypothetical protein
MTFDMRFMTSSQAHISGRLVNMSRKSRNRVEMDRDFYSWLFSLLSYTYISLSRKVEIK